jgi:hypothetical protein
VIHITPGDGAAGVNTPPRGWDELGVMVSGATTAIFAVLVILEVKHFLCDYPLQTKYQVTNKGTYGHPGGIIHAGLHVIGTSFAFLVMTPTFVVGAAILVGEYLVHYHIDWTKEQVMRRTGFKSTDSAFWWTLGTDQLFHHLTYVAITAILVATR